MTGTQLITVVVPAHNVAQYVSEALASVFDQTWPRIELIVVDDGSTDDTASRVEELAQGWTPPDRRMTLLHQANAGSAAARNAGLARASGAFVAFLDADDRWRPRLLDELYRVLAADPALDLAFPLYAYVDEDGTPLGVETRRRRLRYGYRDVFVDNPIDTATGVLVRRDAMMRVGGFDPTLDVCVDLDLWLRIGLARGREAQPIACVPNVLAEHRRNRGGQVTSDWHRMRRGWEAARAKALAADPGLAGAQTRLADARMRIYWSALAYRRGEHAAARANMGEAWRLAGWQLASDMRFWVRTLAAVATLLPGGAHAALERAFNAARRRLSLHFS